MSEIPKTTLTCYHCGTSVEHGAGTLAGHDCNNRVTSYLDSFGRTLRSVLKDDPELLAEVLRDAGYEVRRAPSRRTTR